MGQRDDVACISTYNQAVDHLERTKPYAKGEAKGDTPIGKRSWTHKRIYKDGKGITVRMHSTDVAFYELTGEGTRLTLRPWASSTTDQFMNALLERTNIRTRYNAGNYIELSFQDDRGTQCWHARSPIRLIEITDQTYGVHYMVEHPEEDTEPFERVKIDAKLSRAAYKAEGLPDYFMWKRALKALEKPQPTNVGWGSRRHRIVPQTTIDNLLGAVQDQAYWPMLRESIPDEALRLEVLKKYPDTWTVETVPFVTSLEAQRSHKRTYADLLHMWRRR